MKVLGDKLQGYPIVAAVKMPIRNGVRQPNHVVLVETPTHYVVARHYQNDTEWDHGIPFYWKEGQQRRALDAAVACMLDRAALCPAGSRPFEGTDANLIQRA